MAWNGSGLFLRLYNWVTDRDSSIKIVASRMDAEMDGMATGITACLTKNGENSPSANLPMAGFRHTGVGLSSARTSYARTDQVQDSLFVFGSESGAADAYVVSLSPAITAYVAGQRFSFIADNTCTGGAVTLNINSVGAESVLTWYGANPPAGSITANRIVDVIFDGTNFVLLSGSPFPSATQGEMEAGTESALRDMSPLRVAQAIDALTFPKLRTRYNNSTETLTSSHMYYITVAALSGDITKTLPASTGLANGTIVGFKVESTSGHLLTVTAGGSDNIDWGYGGLSNTFRMSDSDDMVVLALNKTNALWEVIVDRMAGPYFKATRINSSQSIGTSTFTKCQYNTFSEDSHDNYDESTNFRFTPEVEGFYDVKVACFTSATGRHAVVLYKNGSLFEYGSRTYTTSDCVNVGNWKVYLNGSTDYIEVFANSNDAAGTFAAAVTIESYFKARRAKK
jgi:hypothetical protein